MNVNTYQETAVTFINNGESIEKFVSFDQLVEISKETGYFPLYSPTVVFEEHFVCFLDEIDYDFR